MPGQQRYLPRHHTKPGPTGAARLDFGCRLSIIDRDIDHPPCCIVEYNKGSATVTGCPANSLCDHSK